MTPTELTLFIGLAITLGSTIGVPLFLQRRATAQETAKTTEVSWQSITSVLQKERDHLQAELAAIEGMHRQKLRDIEQDYNQQIVVCRSRITHLDAEIVELHRRLYLVSRPPDLL
jgi:DNA-binding XRE family transcriptional regulator